MNETFGRPLALGQRFEVDGDEYILTRYIDLYSVQGTRCSDGERVRLEIAKLIDAQVEAAKAARAAEGASLRQNRRETLSAEQKAELDRLLPHFLPFLHADRPSKAFARKTAEAMGIHVATLYRRRNVVQASGDVADLIPPSPSGGRGKSRLNDESERILQEELENRVLSKNRVRPSRAIKDIQARCRRAGVPAPHLNTLYRRLKSLPRKKIAKKQALTSEVSSLTAYPGTYAAATHPNSVWQIDHTPLDICIVDDVYRRNIGRPWLTLAIDVCSRTVAGFYLSLDPPNEVSVGMCLVHAMLPKDEWLRARRINVRWPNYGRPATVHADNDGTFRGDTVTEACIGKFIRMEWRAVGKAHWGGHIERLLGTLNSELHSLPGTTFSDAKMRAEYKPHEEACFTFDEIEAYLAELICGSYHQNPHSNLQRPPIAAYEDGLLGDGDTVGAGLPAPISDPERLRLDFLPFDSRTVQQYGIQIDKITYYDPILDKWVRALDPKDSKKKRKFVVRRDNRDLSAIYFLDPDTSRYFKVPYANAAFPGITSWELAEVRRFLRERGEAEVDEELIFATYESLRRRKEDAAAKTTKVRRAQQRRKVSDNKRIEEAAIDASYAAVTEAREPAFAVPSAVAGWSDDDEVEAYVEIDVAGKRS